MPANDAEVDKYIIKKIIDKAYHKDGKLYYLVWWEKELKKNASWEPANILEKDAPQAIKDYENNLKLQKKKKK
jgi:hypothetical protein